MPILLGLDTGGTYTDAVLFDPAAGVLATAKSLTTKHDLAIGLGGAMEAVLPHLPTGHAAGNIALVSMSTTLATNAIVESHGAPICLILLGYDEKALERAGLRQALGSDPVVFAAGGHKPAGDEQAPLDLDVIKAAVQQHAPKVAAFAVSGYFSVRNPAHEIAVRQLIRDLTDKPVTCGHELTSKLDAPRRALTAALNARLIPQLQQLIRAVAGLLDKHGIRAPLMVVKGDGSLISAELALTCPVETILSGPAASLVGARYLCGEDTILVSDMGGTTTDIAMLRDGRPVLNKEGATVGGWKTMVEAVAVHTYGLGGDSEIRIDDAAGFIAGPRRVVPLSLLAQQYPKTLDTLKAQLAPDEMIPYRGQFALRQRPLDAGEASLTEGQKQIWDALAEGPVALADLLFSPAAARNLQRLVDRGLVIPSGLTPSDAVHVLEHQDRWCREAAVIGAKLFLMRPSQAGWQAPADHETLCRQIVEQVVKQSGEVILDSVFAETLGVQRRDWGGLGRTLVGQSLAPRTHANGSASTALIDVAVALTVPLAGIGAPVHSYYPAIAERLRTRLVIPRHAEVSNAVGAVAGGVMQQVTVNITAPKDGLFRVHLPDGYRDFLSLETAASHAIESAQAAALALAERAGAVDIQTRHDRRDKVFEQPGGLKLFIESEISAAAFGRPALANE
ncbi:MAG TPA: hydantoinase/oxoprolinase family protein [Terriglobales bacterium]|nr:hydantoinase/oxoprolinase family protein [Terriglobales bacterium]